MSLTRTCLVSLLVILLTGCAAPAPKTDWTAHGLDAETMLAFTQLGLKAHGYDAGVIDGLAGRRTLDAANAYRRANGLPESGTLPDPRLFEALFKDPDYSAPMPYSEGAIRACLRSGPFKARVFLSNLGTIVCSSADFHVSTSIKFCKRHAGVPESIADCELLYDGGKPLSAKKLRDAVDRLSSPAPVRFKALDANTGIEKIVDAVVVYDTNKLGNRQMFDFQPFVNPPYQAPVDSGKPFKFEVRANGNKICDGISIATSATEFKTSLKCFNRGVELRGTNTVVGFISDHGILRPVIRGKLTSTKDGSLIELEPPAGFTPL